MKLSAIRGRIARRVLLNVRIKPEVLESILPPIFKPRLIDGWAIGGICFIALEDLRVPFVPTFLGMKSNNSAHRFAVYSVADDGTENDLVYVPRRDTDSFLNLVASKHCFPAELYRARFEVDDSGNSISLSVSSEDHHGDFQLRAVVADSVMPGSVFKTATELSDFFQRGQIGYSPRSTTGKLDGVRLETDTWSGLPLRIGHFESSFLSDKSRFPQGSVEIDSSFLMRNINHYWYKAPSLDSCLCAA